VAAAGGRDFAIDLELPAFHDAVRARFLAHVDERTPRFFKDGDRRYTVRTEPGPEGERWIRVERPDATSGIGSTPAGASRSSSGSRVSGRW
jgi:hypothetical protein